ncbi:Uncharacterised protein [Legionella lansingensis]|uniref:Uncharacterized protein n=1 Tax=Legionella lansingensis TaxID=45067 RepID=A0A0W0VTK2_9GAMM|nr:hypothetical protein [Legionella lansingensis]KTD23384.1 hypothetical protein Llan_0883 [Legionella lansingensis]SNV49477.1 Uncharacterised protein [Legionella lansingensis]
MSAQDLLNDLQKIIEPYDWSKEVRFNWIRQFSRSLVFFRNPEYAYEFDKLTQEEFLSPKGIIAINRFLNGHASSDLKIAGIKKALLDRGYDGEQESKSWKRTDTTHKVYCALAKAIVAFERDEKFSRETFVKPN